jgi:hypothetical protein
VSTGTLSGAAVRSIDVIVDARTGCSNVSPSGRWLAPEIFSPSRETVQPSAPRGWWWWWPTGQRHVKSRNVAKPPETAVVAPGQGRAGGWLFVARPPGRRPRRCCSRTVRGSVLTPEGTVPDVRVNDVRAACEGGDWSTRKLRRKLRQRGGGSTGAGESDDGIGVGAGDSLGRVDFSTCGLRGRPAPVAVRIHTSKIAFTF